MAFTCRRCSREGETAPAARVPFGKEAKERVLAAICADCWKEWEGMEVKVINEYRLSFLDPQHRGLIQQACFDFLGLQSQ